MMKDKTNREPGRSMTDAEIEQAAANDPDTFVPDANWFANAHIVMPQVKEMVTLRLDHDVVAWFRNAGRGYQTRINAVLRAFIEAQSRQHR